MQKNGVIISDELLSEVMGAFERVLRDQQISPAHLTEPEFKTYRRLLKILKSRRAAAREYWAARSQEQAPAATKDAQPHANPR